MPARHTWPLARPATERRVALIVVLVFLAAGAAWILFTDIVLYSIAPDRTVIARVETAKGWTFVLLAALLIYLVTLRAARQLAVATKTIAAVVESIGDGVLLLGPDRTVAYANPAAVRMLGAASADELRGIGALEFSRRFHLSYPDGGLVPPDRFVSQRAFEEHGPIRYKAVLHPPSGAELVLACTAAGVRAELDAMPELVVSVMHDITAAAQLERLRDELFNEAAHAIKTPVTVIKGATQALAADAPARLQRPVSIIERQCVRIELLIGNILTLARIRSGTLQLHPTEVELGGVVESAAADVARVTDGHDIRVHVTARPLVRVDRERLEMILRNEIYEAIRWSPRHGSVTVRLERNGADTEIGVTYQPDPAAGRPRREREPAMESAEAEVCRYVTASIVDAHGGTLVEQEDARDTTLRIRLPAIWERAAS